MNKGYSFGFLLTFLSLFCKPSWAQLPASSNLPLVIIQMDGNQAVVDDPKRFGNMKLIFRGAGQRNYLADTSVALYLNYNGRIGIERRGSSSQWSSNLGKFSFGFETITAAGANNNVSLLGMPKENDWILNAYVYDKTLIRNALSAEISKRIGRPSAKSFPCEVILNGQYIGVYHLMEKIKQDENRVDLQEMTPSDSTGSALSGGYIYKIDKNSGTNNTSWTSVNGYSRYQYHYPNETNITQAQKAYLKNTLDSLEILMNAAPTVWQDPLNGYAKYIDVLSFTDQHLLHELAGNLDMLASSMYYFKDRGGKIQSGPIWDHDLGYGNHSGFDAWRTDVFFTNRGQSLADGPFYYQKWMFQDMNYRCLLGQRWQALRQAGGPLDQSVLFALIDSLAAPMLESNVREQAKYATLGSNYFNSPSGWQSRTTYQSEIDYLKTWLAARLLWLDANLPYSGACNTDPVSPLVINEIMYNPISDGSTNGDRKFEFIELKNAGGNPIQMQGYFFSNGISYVFPNHLLNPGELIVLASDSLAFQTRYGFAPFGQYFRNLSNKLSSITLSSARGTPIDTVQYADSFPWPYLADGFGRSLELKSVAMNNNLAGSWFTRSSANGSPGLENNFVDSCALAAPLVISEIFPIAGVGIDPGDWIEIYNPQSQSVALQNWVIRDASNAFVLPNVQIAPQSYLVISNDTNGFKQTYSNISNLAQTQFPFGFSASGDVIALENPQGCLIDLVQFQASSPWPSILDSTGKSLQLSDLNLDNNLGGSWSLSPNIGGNPGYGIPYLPPQAVIKDSLMGAIENLPVQISVSGINSSDNQSGLSFQWYLNPDSVLSNSQDYIFTADSSGIYTITLKVTDADGFIDTDQRTWHIGKNPLAKIQANQWSANVNTAIHFNASGSMAFDGRQIIKTTWVWGNGLANDSTTQVSRSFTTPGPHPVLLIVSDNAGLTDSAMLTVFINNSQTTTLVPTNSFWQFRDNGQDQNIQYPSWKTDTSQNIVWPNGVAELGYGDGDETTVVSYGSNASNKYTTTYFRKYFNIDTPALYQGLQVNLKCDDGAVVYLNGVELLRSNLPNGNITYNTFALTAIAGVDESTFNPFFPTITPLQKGKNIIAVEIHQSDLSSSDISFDLQLTAQKSANACTADTGKIVLNELGFDGQQNASGDFIELFSTASDSIRLNEVILVIDSQQVHLPFYTLQPGTFACIASQSSQLPASFPAFSGTLPSIGSFNLQASGHLISVLNAAGCVMDSVRYSDQAPWPQIPPDTACSISLIQTNLNNEDGNHWFVSRNSQITPGLNNYNLALSNGLKHFIVSKHQNAARAEWLIDRPGDYNFFQVEYSRSNDFEAICLLQADEKNNYQCISLPLQNGPNAYRLKLTGIQGEVTYSPVQWLYHSSNQEILVSPNPFQNEVNISMPEYWNDQEVNIEWRSISGQIIHSEKQIIQDNHLNLQTDKLLPGMYFLQLSKEDENFMVKLIKAE